MYSFIGTEPVHSRRSVPFTSLRASSPWLVLEAALHRRGRAFRPFFPFNRGKRPFTLTPSQQSRASGRPTEKLRFTVRWCPRQPPRRRRLFSFFCISFRKSKNAWTVPWLPGFLFVQAGSCGATLRPPHKWGDLATVGVVVVEDHDACGHDISRPLSWPLIGKCLRHSLIFKCSRPIKGYLRS